MDTLSFLRAWAAHPLRVAAVAPSSGALARLMTCEISAETGPVLELGPGTGAFTRALLARGVAERDLTLVECEAGFAALLQRYFPAARILRMDAAEVGDRAMFDAPSVGAVVSGLPLLSMPAPQVQAILDGAFAHLVPNGAFYQFTYGPSCPVRRRILDRLGLKAARIGGTLRNLPPASVYRITRHPLRLQARP